MQFPDLITTPYEVRANIGQFNRDLKDPGDVGDFLADRLAFFRHWYYDPDSGQFGPSKFVGYRGMTGIRFMERIEEPKDGRETEQVLKRWFRTLEPEQPEYRGLRNRLEMLLSANGKRLNALAKLHAPAP